MKEQEQKIQEIYDYCHTHLNRNGYCKKVPDEYILYLYNLDYSNRKMEKILNRTGHVVWKFLKDNNLTRTQEQRTKIRNKTYEERYGCNVAKLQETKDKVKKTNFEKYGNWYAATEESKQKSIQTNMQKFGVDNYAKTDEFKKFIKEKMPEIVEKMNKTLTEKYGEHWAANPELLEKRKKTNLQKYGVEWTMQNEQVQRKTFDSMRKHGTFNSSSEEQFIYDLLCKKFDVKRHYKSSLYPFACDFYIPQLDLYIEYQGSWTHGYMPFNNTPECIEQLQNWEQKAKTSDYYANAIETWMIRDVKKRQIAKENNLNWIEFFNMKEFEDWFNKLN